jgi:[protein-PII] uridylyltransferase
VYILEPHVKEGEGGLRDLHTALWLARVKFKTQGVRELVHKGVLTERQHAEILEARDFLWRVRNALHFMSGQHQDQLTFEYQERIAAEDGFRDTEGRKGVEEFMRTYYLHAATVNRFAEEIIDRVTERAAPYRTLSRLIGRDIRPGVRVAQGELLITDAELFKRDPLNVLAVFRDGQRHGVRLGNAAKRFVREQAGLIDDETRSSEAAAQVFRDILRWKTDVYETLWEMHKLGVLGAYIPEFGDLLCMTQHDLYHIYTVDEHSLMGVRELERLRQGFYREPLPLLTQVMREVDRVEMAFLGILFHDVGKGHGGGHSERGAAMVREVSRRLWLNDDEAAQLEFIVRHHLLMSHLAQRRDVHDPRLVREFAENVGNLDTLKVLYLVTFADMKAVGPKVWNNWKDMLLGELYMQAVEVFETGEYVEQAREKRLERIKERLRGRLADAGVASDLAQAFLRQMPDRYFLSTTEEIVPQHCALLSRLDETVLAAAVEHYPERGFTEFTVATRDRPGLFATIAGVLSVNGMNILWASITTGSDDRVVDVFRVSHDGGIEVVEDDDRWVRVERTLEKALLGEIDVEKLLAQASQRPAFMTRKYVPRVPTSIEIDDEVSDHFSVVDVYSQDRPGLLFTITNTLYHLGLLIELAKITTNVDQVLDVFYVTDAQGRKLDAAQQAEVRGALAETLAAGEPKG